MTNNPPSGTVTFLFTDIEGSTRLWQEQPEAMTVSHARHDAILRTAIESNHGYYLRNGVRHKETGEGGGDPFF